jgi:hypothetical protein
MRSSWSRSSVVVVLFLLASACITYYHLGLFIPHAMEQRAAKGMGAGYSFGGDFYPIWLTAREALQHHRDPYAPEMTRDIQTGLFGRPLDPRIPGDPPASYRAFAYPAYVDLLFWPLARTPFPTVRIALATTLAVLTCISIPLWLLALGIRPSKPALAILLLLTLSSYAVLEGLFAAQPGLLVGFLLAASFGALVKNRLFLAGSLFAFTFIKPQISAIVAIYLLLWSFSRWRERRAFVLGWFAWLVVLVGASLDVRPRWILQWLRVLSGYGSYSPPPLIRYSLGPRLGPTLGPAVTVILLLAAVILMWKLRHVAANSPSFLLCVSLLLALTSITILPGQAVYDHIVLLPGILIAAWTWRGRAASSRPFRVVLAVTALALFWQWIAVVPLLAIKPFLSPEKFFSNSVLLLPLRTAASVPLAVSAVLGFLMAHALRGQRFVGSVGKSNLRAFSRTNRAELS